MSDTEAADSAYPLPAHQTKHLPFLSYPLPTSHRVQIAQDDSQVDSTGRTVWLGAQVLAIYLSDLLKGEKVWVEGKGKGKERRRKRVVDLGAGTGLLSLAMYHMGYDVLSTDIPLIASTILSRNLTNPSNLTDSTLSDRPKIEPRGLDWFSDPSDWDFSRWDISSASSSTTTPSDPPQLHPPIDMILTSDTLYHPSLLAPLLKTLAALSIAPHAKRPPPIYLALEARDPALITQFWVLAREKGFKCLKVDKGRLEKLMGKGAGGARWEEEDWDGVEVWKLKYGGKGEQ